MTNFYFFNGVIKMITDLNVGENEGNAGCYKLISVENELGAVVNFVAGPSTYFVDHVAVSVGDYITGYYDGDAPVPLIYPPQYQALVIVKESTSRNVKVDYFNSQLVSSDGQLQINIAPYTQILLTNGQFFSRIPVNRDLIVIYGASTKSIPAQTTPYRIIVLC